MQDVGTRDLLLFITDLHFWKVVRNPLLLINKRLIGNTNLWLRRRHQFPTEHAEIFAVHALKTGAAQVLVGGDLTCTATEDEFKLVAEFFEFLERRGATVRTVLGNHDVYTYESVRHRRQEKHLGRWLPTSGFPSAQTLPGGTTLILLNTARPRPITSRGLFSERTAHLTARLLADAPKGPVMVCGHYPALEVLAGRRRGSWGHSLQGAEKLRRVMGESERKVLYLAGHIHHFTNTPDPEYSNVHHLTGPAFFHRWAPAQRDGGFLEIDCAASGFRARHHWRSGHWRVEEIPLRQSVSIN